MKVESGTLEGDSTLETKKEREKRRRYVFTADCGGSV